MRDLKRATAVLLTISVGGACGGMTDGGSTQGDDGGGGVARRCRPPRPLNRSCL
jgi:hypothetical protein